MKGSTAMTERIDHSAIFDSGRSAVISIPASTFVFSIRILIVVLNCCRNPKWRCRRGPPRQRLEVNNLILTNLREFFLDWGTRLKL